MKLGERLQGLLPPVQAKSFNDFMHRIEKQKGAIIVTATSNLKIRPDAQLDIYGRPRDSRGWENLTIFTSKSPGSGGRKIILKDKCIIDSIRMSVNDDANEVMEAHLRDVQEKLRSLKQQVPDVCINLVFAGEKINEDQIMSSAQN